MLFVCLSNEMTLFVKESSMMVNEISTTRCEKVRLNFPESAPQAIEVADVFDASCLREARSRKCLMTETWETGSLGFADWSEEMGHAQGRWDWDNIHLADTIFYRQAEAAFGCSSLPKLVANVWRAHLASGEWLKCANCGDNLTLNDWCPL